ncbi:hypothetical protein [Fibrivirga algicola]|uniref:XRE family transcriptional regulator n=1 Tax=Fibrivirga algicola TaxID=2950420 RepID=A0ABX0QSA5_9BACT|nr:hypothetical protein [Fibrivirga algicola]NID13772.1 hypothetical protein [Fibrivirga algicola]
MISTGDIIMACRYRKGLVTHEKARDIIDKIGRHRLMVEIEEENQLPNDNEFVQLAKAFGILTEDLKRVIHTHGVLWMIGPEKIRNSIFKEYGIFTDDINAVLSQLYT